MNGEEKIFPDYSVNTTPAGAGQFTTGVSAIVRTKGKDGKWYTQIVSHSHRGRDGEVECEREAVKYFVKDCMNTIVFGLADHKLEDSSGHSLFHPDPNQQSEKERLADLLPKPKKK